MQCARIYAARQPSPRGGLSVQMDRVYITGESATSPCSFECRRTSSAPTPWEALSALTAPKSASPGRSLPAENDRTRWSRACCAPYSRASRSLAPGSGSRRSPARQTTRAPAVGLVADAGVEARGKRMDSRPREPLRERQNVGNLLQHVRSRFERRDRGLWVTGGRTKPPHRRGQITWAVRAPTGALTSPKPCPAPGQRRDPTQCPTSPIPPGGIEPPLRA